MKTQSAPSARSHRLSFNSIIRIGTIVALIALIGIPLFSSSSASSSLRRLGVRTASTPTAVSVSDRIQSKRFGGRISDPLFKGSFTPSGPLSLVLPQASESIATYEFPGCTVPKDSFNLGETVCAVITGASLGADGRAARRIGWVSPYGSVTQGAEITTDPQTGSYLIPTTATQTFIDAGGGTVTVDNRGTWSVGIYSAADGSLREAALFTVHDPQTAYVDLSVHQAVGEISSQVGAGSSGTFEIFVTNTGPDAGQTVLLTGAVPADTTFDSLVQNTGLPFDCTPLPSQGGTGSISCTLASMPNGDTASFTLTYTVNGGVPGGTQITNAVSISSATAEIVSADNSSTASSTVPADTGSPTCSLTCPASQTVNNESGQAGAHVTFAAPTASGTCGVVSCSAQSGDFFSIGTTQVTCTSATEDTCTFTVRVIDTEDPVIGNCPANITATEDAGTPGEAVVNYATPSATDNSEDVTVTCSSPSGSSFTVSGSPHTVTCTATDRSGRTDSCAFDVTVTPGTTECTLTPPANITEDSPANQCGKTVNYTDPTQSGTCGTVTCDRPSGSFFPVGTTVVSCRDTSGATTQFNVTVNDTTAPVPDLMPLPTIMGDCTATAGIPTPKVIHTPTGDITIIVMEPPTATDNCGGRIAGTTEDPRTYQNAGTFTVHWTYTDASGNTSTQNQTIVVTGDDTSPPTITAPGPVTFNTGPTSTSCGVTITDLDVALGEAIANDSCSVATVERLGVPAGNVFPVGMTTLTYTATDESGHQASATQAVTVVDNTLPVLTAAPGPVTLYTGAGATSCGVTVTDLDATLGTGTAHDNCAFTITRLGLPAGNVFPVGLTTITYKVVDASGNQGATTATQDVTVVDNTPPTITLSGANPQYVECHTSYPELGATANDNCGNFAATPSGTVNVNTPGTYTITYNATDPAGNAATPVTRTVIVQDTIAPTVTAPTDVSVNTGPGATSCGTTVSDATLGTASANDSCAGSLSVTRTGVPAGNVFPVGQTTITYSATDPSNNTGTATQTVTVTDNTPPTIVCPANITLEPTCPTGAIATYAVPVGDNCGVQSTVATTSPTVGLASGSVFPIGTTTVTTTVTDIHGNSSSCSFTVTVLTPQAVIQNMIPLVNALQPPLSGQQVQGLQSKLQAALDAINDGKTNVACNKLADFINQVGAYINNGTLTSAQGQPLINSANNVRNTIGCTNNPCT